MLAAIDRWSAAVGRSRSKEVEFRLRGAYGLLPKADGAESIGVNAACGT